MPKYHVAAHEFKGNSYLEIVDAESFTITDEGHLLFLNSDMGLTAAYNNTTWTSVVPCNPSIALKD